jgi:hypothetical protein
MAGLLDKATRIPDLVELLGKVVLTTDGFVKVFFCLVGGLIPLSITGKAISLGESQNGDKLVT